MEPSVVMVTLGAIIWGVFALAALVAVLGSKIHYSSAELAAQDDEQAAYLARRQPTWCERRLGLK